MTSNTTTSGTTTGGRDRAQPLQIAAETFVIQDHQTVGGEGVLHVNSMLIRGAEPTVIDTGASRNRDDFLNDLFTLVEPADIRWLFLSHDDADHVGNAAAVLRECPKATAVTTWIAAQRLAAGGHSLPPERCCWLDDGGVLDIGDRALVALCPPLYDAPGTRGLLDTSTNVFWTVDCFAAYVPAPTIDIDQLDLDVWDDGFVRFHQWNSPWIDAIDAGWWQRTITQLTSRQLTAIASAHGPVLRGTHLSRGIEALRELPALPMAKSPQHDLGEGALGDGSSPRSI